MRTMESSAVLNPEEDIRRTAICGKYTVKLQDPVGTLTSFTNRKVGICFLGAQITKCATKALHEDTIIVFTYHRVSNTDKYCDDPMSSTFNFPSSKGILSWFFSCIGFGG